MKTLLPSALAFVAALSMQSNIAAQDRAEPRTRDVNTQRDEKPRAEEPRRRDGGEREAQVAKLRAQLEELAAAGKFEEAAEVKRRIAELTERRAPDAGGDNPEITQLQNKLRELVEQQRFDEAAQVKRRLEELGAARGLRASVRGGERGDNPEARLQAMMAQAEKLRAAGQNEEADRIMREAEGLKRQFADPRGRGEKVERGDNPETRLREMTAQAEKLRAAGQNEEADRILREVGEAKRQLAERRERGAGDGRVAERPARDPRADEVFANIKELRAELNELRQAVAELKRQLDEKKK
ncbi:MAG: UvrB/UvrC motif-containing protein [Verrucomicrobia bacterium]|nr:UvrB/UvrC motif-containing protein [Verrucomicrobiota bacterium]